MVHEREVNRTSSKRPTSLRSVTQSCSPLSRRTEHCRSSVNIFLVLNVSKARNTKHGICLTTFNFGTAPERFPSRQDAVRGAENINIRALAIFHFTDGFEVYSISIPHRTRTDPFRQYHSMRVWTKPLHKLHSNSGNIHEISHSDF
jgi:hypothetical protein